MADPTPKPTAKLSPAQAQAAYSARQDANLKLKGNSGAVYTPPKASVPKSVSKPVNTKTTPTTTSAGAGSYGSPVAGAYASTVTSTVPMNVGGKVVQVPVAEALKLGQGGSQGLPTVIAALREKGQISKTTNNMTTISNAWNKVVFAAMRSGQDPFAYISTLPTPVTSSSSKVSADGTTTYVTDYSGSKGQSAFQAAFGNVFGRNPVAGDQISPLKDSKGNPLTWIQALNIEAQKPGNAETVTRTGTNVVTKGGFDAQAWLTGQLADYYRKGIQTGTLTPEQGVANQYASLANDYGIDVYDPTTKGFNPNARLDLAALESKTKTLDQIKQGWANSTVAKYGNLTPQLVQAGLTLRQVADPALSSMSNILGVDKNSISLNDQLVQKYLAGDGKSVMPAYQYEQLLRQDPRWKNSKDAQDNLSNVALTMAKTFGVIG